MTTILSPLPHSQAPTYPLQEQLHACAKALIDAELPALVPALLPPAEYQALHHPNGKRAAWLDALATLPVLQTSQRNFNSARVQLGQATDASPEQRALLENVLKQFIPWRKGPFELFGIHIDTEWRSDWKWQRIIPHISPLQGKTVLDIGCGSGYHLWRMQGQGARLVLGIDPSLFFLMQFHCIRHYSGQPPVHFLPLRSEDLPDLQGLGQGFDSVFSMGVLYHRRSPLQHLQELKAVLKPGGELILETLVIEQSQQNVLMPENRYAKMRNVWFIPTVSLLELWLKRLGFVQVRCVDITATTLAEQRATPWMQFESLADFLDPEDRQCTIEGYPAPVRATIVASRPN